jgi:hypothetical protein
MSPNCIKVVQAAAAAAGRKALTKAELKRIDDDMSATLKLLSQRDPNWPSMTRDQRLTAASNALMAQIAADAKRVKDNALQQIVKQTQVDNSIKNIQAATKGASLTDATKRHMANTHNMIRQIRNSAVAGLMDTIQALGDKTGAGLGRRFMMAVFDAENPIMTRDVIREIYKGADGHSGNKAAQAGAKAWLETVEKLRTRFNAAGGDVGRLDYGYVPRNWDASRVRKAGADKWAADMLPEVDRARMVNEDGSRMSDAEVMDFLRASWRTLSTSGVNKQVPGEYHGTGKRANRGSDHRLIHFKDGESDLRIRAMYGRGSVFDAMAGHIGGISRDIGLVERYGPDPASTARLRFDMIAQSSGKELNEAIGMPEIDPRTYWDMISGKTSTPVNERMANIGVTARNIQTFGKLGGAMISSMTDVATLAITTGYNRMSYWEVLKDVGRQVGSKEAREWMNVQGIVAESLANGIDRWSGDFLGQNWSGKLANATMKLSLMNRWTDSMRQGFSMAMAGKLAEMAKKPWADVSQFDRARLERAGIGEQEWAVLQQTAPSKYKGGEYLTPASVDSVSDIDIQRLRAGEMQAITDRINQQTAELAARNAQEAQWIAGRIEKFDDARDALNRQVKAKGAKRDANAKEAAGQLRERVALLDAQREAARLQSEIEGDYNKLFTKADIDAFASGMRKAANDLGSATRKALSAAEQAGADFGARKQRIEQRMRDAQSKAAAGGDAERALLKMAEQQASLERAALQRDLEIAFKATPDAERQALKAAMDGVKDVRGSAADGMRSAERIGRRYGEAKGRLERRIAEIEGRIAEIGSDAGRATDADAKAAQKKADDMAAELRDFTKRSQDRQARRQAVIAKLHAEELPRLTAEAQRIRQDVADKLGAWIMDEGEFAVVNPDLRTRALTTMGGQQSGTPGGEFARTIMQFKSFPIALISRHWSRMLTDSRGLDGAPMLANRAMYGFALMTSLTALGAIVTQTKQALQGKDPIDMTGDHAGRFWSKAFAQGGGLGIMGDLLLIDPSSSFGDSATTLVKNLAGPTVGTFAEVVAKDVLENAWQAAEGKDTHAAAEVARTVTGLTPGVGLWWIKPFFEHGVTHAFSENMSPGYLARMKSRAKKDWGNEYWWKPGEALPDRAPDIGKAVENAAR